MRFVRTAGQHPADHIYVAKERFAAKAFTRLFVVN